jgi:hypothetical protein
VTFDGTHFVLRNSGRPFHGAQKRGSMVSEVSSAVQASRTRQGGNSYHERVPKQCCIGR